jgi:GNAT superfamily N-acetyltransferase
MKKATIQDVSALVELMTEFYAEGDFPLNRGRAEEVFRQLLENENLGQVWLLEDEGSVVGHLVLVWRFSLEYGGRIAVVEDLFVRPGFRRRGYAREGLLKARELCGVMGIRAMLVETGFDNPAAQQLYERVGFAVTDRQHLTLPLADPLHVD